MPGEVAAGPQGGAPEPQNGQQQNGGGAGSGWVMTVVRMVLFWGLMQYMRSSNTQVKGGLHGIAPKFSKGEPVDVFVYLSESQQFAWEGAQLLWQEESVPLADVKAGDYEKSITYVPSESVQNNGSVWLHVLFARHGYPIDPDAPNFNADAVFGRRYPLTEYVPPRKEREGVNLLEKREAADSEEAAQPSEAGAVDVGGIPGEEVEAEVEPAKPWINVWKPNITITMVADFTKYNPSAIPPQVKPVLDIDHRTDTYWPTVWFDDFWLLRNYMIPVNDTVPELQLHLGLGSTPVWWWTLLQQLESSFQTQVDSGLMSDTETDEFKRILLEGNPYLLALTFVVSILHSVFDFLAFKNDIGFWRNNKSMEGLSGRTILINSFCQLVIFLYLLDNDTSFVVLLSSGVGMCIEFWKVTKAYDVSLKQEFPFLSIKDRVSYVESMTKKYDDEASKYMSWVLYPLVTGYAVYSLVYDKHKSWYSWVVNSLVGAVYAFGFILMCPQLYLNYKLKSVAHLPWRQMTYKFLNTIIDDLFAFVIKMPLLHRLSVFRDDVIFLIYLYQRWIYPVDKLRVNEFGFSAEPPPEATEAEEKPPEQLQSAADTGDDAPAESGSEGLRQRVKAKASEAAQEGEECADGDSSELPKKDK